MQIMLIPPAPTPHDAILKISPMFPNRCTYYSQGIVHYSHMLGVKGWYQMNKLTIVRSIYDTEVVNYKSMHCSL